MSIDFSRIRANREIKEFPKLTEGTHVFKVVEVDESNLKYDKLSITLETAEGARMWENFKLDSDNGISALEVFCNKTMNLTVPDDFDLQKLVGNYVKFEIEQREYNDKKYWNKKKGAYYLEVPDSEKFVKEEPTTEETSEPVEITDDDPSEWC